MLELSIHEIETGISAIAGDFTFSIQSFQRLQIIIIKEYEKVIQ